MGENKLINYAEQIELLFEALQVETDAGKRRWYAESIAKLEEQEIKSRGLALQEKQLETSNEIEKSKIDAESDAKLEEQELKRRELAVQEKQLETSNKIEIYKIGATIFGAIVGAAGLIIAAMIKAAAHQEAIDRVAAYENEDVIFTGKKYNEIPKIG